jgi:hypothetical protein
VWRICSKQELWSQKNSRCWLTALKQYSFLGNGRETNNGTTSIARQQILNMQQLNSNRRTVFCAVRAKMLKTTMEKLLNTEYEHNPSNHPGAAELHTDRRYMKNNFFKIGRG